MKSLLALCALLSLALAMVSANCSGNCPDTENVVWALGSSCNVFRNKCYFDKENCHRKPALTEVTREECQKKCAEICPAIYSPVTGSYKGVSREFSNACHMAAHVCRTGETYLAV